MKSPHIFHQSVCVVAAGSTLFSTESLRRIVAHHSDRGRMGSSLRAERDNSVDRGFGI